MFLSTLFVGFSVLRRRRRFLRQGSLGFEVVSVPRNEAKLGSAIARLGGKL